MIEGDTRREITVDTDQKHQGKVEAYANIICQLKQRDWINKEHEDMYIRDVDKVSHVSNYPLLESMGFDNDIYYGVVKMRAATILGDIVSLNQCIKNPLKYVQTKSKYGHLVAIIDYDTHESF